MAQAHSAWIGAVLFCAALPLSAAEYYVARGGLDSNPGTNGLPFASLGRAQQAANPGDTVWIRGGVYEFVGDDSAGPAAVQFDKSGTPGNRINYWAYPGETPIFDFSKYIPQKRIRGFSVQADWLHFRGLELRGVQQTIANANESWAIRVEEPLGTSSGNGGDNNVFERLNLHHNEGPGLYILHGGNNLVLNSDSHHNYDPDRGGLNADGFGSHSNDDGNVFIGNRAWENSDDGFDFINSPGVVTLDSSWAWRNGYIPGSGTAAGTGAGIKGGGFQLDPGEFPDPGDIPRHVIRNNIAFNNRVQGFYANHHPGGISWINNTAVGNQRGFDLLADVQTETWPAHHYLRNNIAFGNIANLINDTQSDIDDEYNTWNDGYAMSPSDFLNLFAEGINGPRQADGSLPNLEFLRLAPTSGLIDAGAKVGLAYRGVAPDMGAFETVPGDFNGNGTVDAADYVILRLDNGTAFTAADYITWANHFGETFRNLPGDFNGDGTVDAADYVAWRLGSDTVFTSADYVAWATHFGETLYTLPGDFNHDGTVDAADYVVWRLGRGTAFTDADYINWITHFGESLHGGGSLAHEVTNIPEPTPWPLLGGLLLASAHRPRRP